jgi:glycosyltransferase involved in cell wall biosynthesis
VTSITIITPSYNQARFLEATLVSVLSQHYPRLEYLVLDGGSTDGTAEILDRYRPQLSFCRSHRDGGQAAAINEGLRRATGDIIGILNSDDLYVPGALSVVERLFANDNIVARTGNARVIDEAGRLLYVQRGCRFGWRNHLGVNNISHPATFCRRFVHEETGPLNEQLHYNLDGEYWLRIARKYRFTRTSEVLACMRVHRAAKTSLAAGQRVSPHDLEVEWATRRYGRLSRVYRITPLFRALRAAAWLETRCEVNACRLIDGTVGSHLWEKVFGG